METCLTSRLDGAHCRVKRSAVYLSIVVPLYNEVENIPVLFAAMRDALSIDAVDFEMIFVDDGSSDGSLSALQSLQAADERVRIVRLRRNCGQTIAMRTGIEYARGSVIVTMDGDLQNDPADVMKLVDLIEEGYDLVSGWRADRKDPFLSRKLPSMVANWLISKFLETRVHDLGCSLKAYRPELIQQIPLYSDLHRFIPVMCSMASTRFTEVKVNHRPRCHGTSKYGISRTGRVMLDALAVRMLIRCTQRPLHWFGSWAVAAFFVAACLGAIAGISAIGSHHLSMVLLSMTLAFGYLGMHLVSFGLLGEIIARTKPTSRVMPLVDIIGQRSVKE